MSEPKTRRVPFLCMHKESPFAHHQVAWALVERRTADSFGRRLVPAELQRLEACDVIEEVIQPPPSSVKNRLVLGRRGE